MFLFQTEIIIFSNTIFQSRNENTSNEKQILELKNTIRDLNTKISTLKQKIIDLTKKSDIIRINDAKTIEKNKNLNNTDDKKEKEKDSVEELKKIIKEKMKK